MAGAFYFTQHAVERFKERWAPGFTFSHALRELIAMSLRARKLRRSAKWKGELYEIGDRERIILVVRHDLGRQGGVVTTVFSADEVGEEGDGVPD